jgi:hypothetical protein
MKPIEERGYRERIKHAPTVEAAQLLLSEAELRLPPKSYERCRKAFDEHRNVLSKV